MYNIYKIMRTGNGWKERIIIKSFKTSDAMHKFLNEGITALTWKECTGKPYAGLKSGTYAYAGGQYHNVKSLDVSVLAHI